MADTIYKSKYTGEQIEEMLDNASKVSNIVPNPVEEGTTPLTKITIGETVYFIPDGDSVTPNPSAVATDVLSKLQIGNTVYSIGAGSNIYKYELQVTLESTIRKFYFESPYILETIDDIFNYYKVDNGDSCIATYGYGNFFTGGDCVFLAYIQVSGNMVGFYYFNIISTDRQIYYAGSNNINVYSPIITRLNNIPIPV